MPVMSTMLQCRVAHTSPHSPTKRYVVVRCVCGVQRMPIGHVCNCVVSTPLWLDKSSYNTITILAESEHVIMLVTFLGGTSPAGAPSVIAIGELIHPFNDPCVGVV